MSYSKQKENIDRDQRIKELEEQMQRLLNALNEPVISVDSKPLHIERLQQEMETAGFLLADRDSND